VQVQRALSKQRLAHGACARGIPASGGGAGGEQSAQARHAAARAAGQARRQRTDAQQQLQGREAIWPLAWHMAAGRQALAGKH